MSKGPLRPVAICHAPKLAIAPNNLSTEATAPDSAGGSDSAQTRFQMHREAAAAGQAQARENRENNISNNTNPSSQSQGQLNQTQSNNSSPPTAGAATHQEQEQQQQQQTVNTTTTSLTANHFLNQQAAQAQAQAQASLASSVMYQQQQWQQAQAMYAYWNMYNVYNAALNNHLMQQQQTHPMQPIVCSPSAYPGAPLGSSPTMLKVQQQSVCATGTPRVPLVLTPTLKVQETELQNGSTNSMNSTSTTVTHNNTNNHKRAERQHHKKRPNSHDKIRKTDEHRKVIKKGSDSSQNKVCSNCGTSSTPFWRKNKIGGLPLCNACGLYYSKNDAQRPKELWKQEEHMVKPLR